MIIDSEFAKDCTPKIQTAISRFEIVGVEEDKIKVEWDWCGEGNSGDYQPSDPEDQPLLRFTVYKTQGAEWHEIDDSSYCTLIPITTPEEMLGKLARYILDKVISYNKYYRNSLVITC
jgi:hypothetical protein